MPSPLEPGCEVWRTTPGGGGPAVVVRDYAETGARGEREPVRIRLPSGKEATVKRSTLRPMHTPGVRAPSRVERPRSEEAGHLAAQPKPKTARSRGYLDFIRSKPCACCGAPAPSQAAHWGGPGASGGTGLKASDFYTLPACDACHRDQHRTGAFPKHTPYGPDNDDAWVYRKQRDLIAEYAAGLEER